MPLTVAQALEIDVFTGAQVIAGSKGLSNPIRWVHVCELPDSGQYLIGNEVVLTTGGSLRTRAQYIEYIQSLALAKIAALVIFLGRGLSKVPSYWRELADEWAIPLILAPPGKSFVTVSEELIKIIQAEAAEEAKRRLPRSEMVVTNRLMAFFQDVLSGEIAGRGIVELAADRLGLPPGGDYSVVIFRYQKDWSHTDIFKAIAEIIQVINEAGLTAWCVPGEFWRGRLTLVISIGEEDDKYRQIQAVKNLYTRLKERFPRRKVTSIGIGRPYSLDELPKSFREARQASEAGGRRENKSTGEVSIQHFGDLGLYRLLYAVEDKRELVSFYRESVAKLVEGDRSYNHDLLKTLEVYFQHEGNLTETAAALYIHRHTLRYRLQKVEELTGLKLNRFEDRLTLLLGLMIWQMLRGEREVFSYPNV
ncbi:MAG: PucR family transcriptional regulator ligand-binding domain-containing protein [Firmicutes bacterium]|nr:PucR family transcriptional regulator ligand-binding domain-containing protein [Bacillota bacterium]